MYPGQTRQSFVISPPAIAHTDGHVLLQTQQHVVRSTVTLRPASMSDGFEILSVRPKRLAQDLESSSSHRPVICLADMIPPARNPD